jgi:hypothetical protein
LERLPLSRVSSVTMTLAVSVALLPSKSWKTSTSPWATGKKISVSADSERETTFVLQVNSFNLVVRL